MKYDHSITIERAKAMKGAERARRVAEIRLISIAALHGETEGFEPWQYFAELKWLSEKPPTIPYLEASIATCVAGRIRAPRSVRLMKLLRKQRRAAGEENKFVEFEALVQSSLGSATMTNHGYGKATFASLDHTQMWSNVGSHVQALRDFGYEVFLNSGTLLGVVRDGRLIDHDDDIDLAVILKAGSAQEAAEEWKTLRGELNKRGVFDQESFRSPTIYKLKSSDGCEIDLFPAWFEGDKFFVYPHTFGELSRGEVLPLKPCAVSGEPIPLEPEKMLALNYGAKWREPDPYFKFSWVVAGRKFRTFLDALQ